MIEDNPRTSCGRNIRRNFNALAQTRTAGMRLSTPSESAQQRKRSLKNRLDKLEDRHASEDIVYFDQLGVDCIFMDEVHSYKRNFFVTKMTRVKGLDNAASQKAFSLTLKLNQIREKTGGRNIYTATGTPVTNQLPELFNMVRYVSRRVWVFMWILSTFASTFTRAENGDGIECRRTPQNGLAVL